MTERESEVVRVEIEESEEESAAVEEAALSEEAAEEIGPDTEVEILDMGEGDDEEPAGEGSDDDAEVAELRREIAELRDRSMRTLADFDNFRKRTERERAEMRRYAGAELIRDFLEAVDNLERAVAAGGSAEDLKTGVEMILRQIDDALRRHGVVKVAAVGERFDPNVHEAVSRQEDPEVDEPTVVEEMQTGYRLHERLLRPSRVVVAVPADEA